MTVAEFYRRFGDQLPPGLPRDRQTLRAVIGQKRPDLAAYNPKTGQAIVADLTAQFVPAHLRKTYLDMEILKVAVAQGYARGVGILQGGDYFYNPRPRHSLGGLL